jgi:hypothetical protein
LCEGLVDVPRPCSCNAVRVIVLDRWGNILGYVGALGKIVGIFVSIRVCKGVDWIQLAQDRA